MSGPTPITLDEQIRYCEEEAARWNHISARGAAKWAEAYVRHNYYCAILASLRYLKNHHDLSTTQEIEPVTVTMCPGYPGVEVNNDK
jgi:hypothetical protein